MRFIPCYIQTGTIQDYKIALFCQLSEHYLQRTSFNCSYFCLIVTLTMYSKNYMDALFLPVDRVSYRSLEGLFFNKKVEKERNNSMCSNP